MTPEEARSRYRAAWSAYLLATESDMIAELERLMDEAQPFIATGPADPAWREFIKTLPGYEDFWKRLASFRSDGGFSRWATGPRGNSAKRKPDR